MRIAEHIGVFKRNAAYPIAVMLPSILELLGCVLAGAVHSPQEDSGNCSNQQQNGGHMEDLAEPPNL